jgi:ABC-type phosphate transport system substrate-binding protein
MHHRIAKLGLAGVSVITIAFAFALPAAVADVAPQPGDAVGVGSDTVQYASDFVADGNYVGGSGFNSSNPLSRVVNFDATPDANARLAYGSGGATSSCAPGTGTHNGTANDTTGAHADTLCVLNPTIVVAAGTKPIQRPNGSGAGATALANDTVNNLDEISYSRASTCQDTSCGGSALNPSTYDVITIGKDPLQILSANTTNAPSGLSIPELKGIYACTTTQWSQLNSSLPSTTIIPVIPQVGSGTRKQFEQDLGIGDTFPSCVHVAEENDPTAIYSQLNASSVADSADVIEPMSGGRLNLFQGLSGKTGSALAGAGGGYFQDPTCPNTALGAVNPGGTCSTKPLVAPAVKFLTGTAPDSKQSYDDNRLLYIYFRKSDVNSSTPFEPGSSLNMVRTLLYNPCTPVAPATTCTGFGTGGAPFYDSSLGQADIAAAGINPFYDASTSGAQTLITNDGSPIVGN